MTTFESRLHYTGAAGAETLTVAPEGGVAGLGRIVGDSIGATAPNQRETANAFLRVLRGSRSHWPSTGRTGNIGPYATDTSVRAFRVARSRGTGGRFAPGGAILNEARNKRGRPYAVWVDRGIRGVPGQPGVEVQVAGDRYAANFNAVARTWRDNRRHILAIARGLARQRLGIR